MKRFSILLALVLVSSTVFYFVSCKKEKVYSCNESLNDYATINLENNQTISRDRLAGMGIDTQFAIFNSLSSNNKARIMKEKIQVLIDMDNVPKDDKIHLEKLYDYLTKDVYENRDKGNDDFLEEWKAYAINTLQWDEERMGIYLYTWLTKDEILGGGINGSNKFIKSLDANDTGDGNKLSCKCSWGWVCGAWRCVDGGCTKTDSGCGFLCLYACSGDCKP